MALKGEVDVNGAASVFLAANFSSLTLRSFIFSFIGETIGRSSLLLEVTELHLTSRWLRMSSPLLRPSQLKTLRDSLRTSSVGSLACDFAIVSSLIVRPEAKMFRGQEGHASSCFHLIVVAERVDSAYE